MSRGGCSVDGTGDEDEGRKTQVLLSLVADKNQIERQISPAVEIQKPGIVLGEGKFTQEIYLCKTRPLEYLIPGFG